MALPAGRAASWSCLEDVGDAFEGVLALLEPGDVAACRLVSSSWRKEVDSLVQKLAPAAGAQPAAIAATFPHLTQLQLSADGAGDAAAGSSGGSCGALPPLDALPALRRLRSLKLQARATGMRGQLDCRALLPLRGGAPLRALEVAHLQLGEAAALRQLTQLTRLHLSANDAPAGWQDSLPSLLLPLRGLAHLHFSCTLPVALRLWERTAAAAAAAVAEQAHAEPQAAVAAAVAAAAAAAVPEPADCSLGLLEGLSQLTSLQTLELTARDAASDAACQQIAALPRLTRLAITRCDGFGLGAPSVTDSGLEALAVSPLSRQLTSLSLVGHLGVTDAGLAHIARFGGVQRLELRLGVPPGMSRRPVALQAGDAGVAALSGLLRLQSLHLGGSMALGEAGCAALARRLGSLTSLCVTDCASLADPALFRLSPLAPRLHRLRLNGCVGVTDIGLAVMVRGASSLERLELAGCHRNITGIGLRLNRLPRLRHLDLAGCDAIADTEMEAILQGALSLEHLNLRDCRVTDQACALLAASSPGLRYLSLEHCAGVGNEGLRHLAAGLPLLSELRLFGSSVSDKGADVAMRARRARPLQLGLHKQCWWVNAMLGGSPGGSAPASPTAAVAAA